jgi:hypothetical protein
MCCYIAPAHKFDVFQGAEENKHSEIGETGK